MDRVSFLLRTLIVLLAVGCAVGASCVRAQVRLGEQRPAMGTVFSIVVCADDSTSGRAAIEAAFDRVRELEKVLSDYAPESEVSRLAHGRSGERVAVSDDLAAALALADSWWRRTNGAFDASLGALTRLWRRAIRRGEVPRAPEIVKARSTSGWHLVDRSRDGREVAFGSAGVRLDFGGIGKGLAADEALSLLAAWGIDAAVVDAGGDVTASDPPPGLEGWLVEGPDDRYWHLSNGSIATSGATWKHLDEGAHRYSHIIDPGTGYGVLGHRIVTVFARRGADADALASAFSVLGPEDVVEIARREGVGALIDDPDAGLTAIGSWPPPAINQEGTPWQLRNGPASEDRDEQAPIDPGGVTSKRRAEPTSCSSPPSLMPPE